MTVIETRLSPKVEAGFTAVPVWNTRVVSLRNGHERRNAQQTMPKRRFSARYAKFTRAERGEMLNVVMATLGQTYAFLFKDWSDFDVTGQSLGVAPSGSTAVQLVKTYTFGSQTLTRTITRPVAATVVVYQADGSGNPIAKAGTVSATTGLFTPSTAWTAGRALTADFQFDLPVRFATDEVEFVLPHRDIAEVNCELVEVFGE
jgi:uncharacterized protein (TIGR02217 family)